jgi:hypothetical protein
VIGSTGGKTPTLEVVRVRHDDEREVLVVGPLGVFEGSHLAECR